MYTNLQRVGYQRDNLANVLAVAACWAGELWMEHVTALRPRTTTPRRAATARAGSLSESGASAAINSGNHLFLAHLRARLAAIVPLSIVNKRVL